MECFIKKIFDNRADNLVHNQFVRFGKGDYKGRAALNLWKTGKIKLSGSYEYTNDFVLFASEFQVKFSGIIFSKEQLGLEGEKKKSGLYVYEVSGLDKEKIEEIADKAYYMLLDCEGEVSLKMKKKLPKPGKGGGAKIDDRFCVLESELDTWQKIKEAFCWDVDGKRIKISHEYIIQDLVMPKPQELKIPDGCQNSERILKDEKDFAVIREKTKRKGILVRKIEVDGRVEEKKINFEV